MSAYQIMLDVSFLAINASRSWDSAFSMAVFTSLIGYPLLRNRDSNIKEFCLKSEILEQILRTLRN